MVRPGATGGLDTAPRRIFLAGHQEPIYGADGFVLPIPPGKVLTAADLLTHAAVLVLAPPWTGKTFVAEQLESALRAEAPLRSLPFEGRCHRTPFEEELGRSSRIQPPWWDAWKQGQDRACWIVDALDEDERRGDHRIQEILDLVEELQEEARSRLHLLFFARLNEVPARFQSRAQQLFRDWSPAQPQGLRRVRLAGLDREAARGLVGQERFERVSLLIEKNGLRELASYPAILEYLRQRASLGPDDVTQEEVWRGVLTNLLRDRRGSLLPLSQDKEVEDSFEVVQRLATLLTFCGHGELRVETFQGLSGLEELLPPAFPDFRILRQAARQALTTAVFERTENGFRFAQDHVREWFVAFALSDMPLLRVRPLLTDKAGSLNRAHEGVMGLLAQISKYDEVREWIAAAHGGLAPPSDAAPWSLSQAVQALDRLQDLAQSSPWGLHLWREERLKRLNIPGVGPELARRLRLPLHPTEQELLLNLAVALGVSEAVEPAVELLQAEGQDERVRTLAADLVTQMGTVEQLEPLSRWVRSQPAAPRDSALSILVSGFYTRGLWNFEATTEFVLGESGLSGDWLQYRLAEDLSKDRSRWLISTFLLPAPVRLSEHLLGKALERLLEGDLEDVDHRLFIELALRGEEWEQADFSLARQVLLKIQKNPIARRELFLQGLHQNPDPKKKGHWLWKAALGIEDIEWLLEMVRERQGRPEWLWETLYWLSRRKGVQQSAVRRVRQTIRSSDDHLLAQLDKDWRTLRGSEHREQASQEQMAKQSYELAPLAREVLSDPDLTVCRKMRRLSWICFMKPNLRPTNVSGRWEDFERELQAEVLVVCHEALDTCTPTPIPGGMTYPSAIHWEAASFHRLVSEDVTFALTPTMIQKWLPALLKTLEREWEPTLRACFATDQDTSQELFLEAVLREVQTEGGSTYLVQELPKDLWSEHLASRLEDKIVEAEGVSLPLRIDLLIRISRVFPARAQSIALRWAEAEGELQDAGIDLLLSVDPREGWPQLRRLISVTGEARPALLRMHSLLPHHSEPDATFASWPVELLEELTRELFQAFPPESDPQRKPGEAYSLGAEDDLRSLRDRLPSLLHRRDQPGDRAALERLAGRYVSIREWLDQIRAGEGAEGVLSGVGLSKSAPAQDDAIPLQDLIRILQEERYRAVRTAGDLQAVVLQEIRLLSTDAKQHLAMLYGSIQKGGRKRLHEEALQAYLLCRLQDRLTTAVLGAGTRVFLDRETLAARNTRNDLKVQASSVSNERLTVVIEVKWSDNKDVSTSLVEQLGRQYLLDNGLTHGIYLVGWCGRFKPWRESGEPPDDLSSPDAWRRALETQAEALRQQHPELHIAVVILDLSWDASIGP